MKEKKRYIAMLLSIIVLFGSSGFGVGHFYIGKYKKAFLYLIAPFIIFLIGMQVFINEYIYIFSLLFLLFFYVYYLVDVWRSFPLEKSSLSKNSTSLKYSRWYFVLLFIILNYAISIAFILWYEQSEPKIKHFIVPTSSMSHTIVRGDMLVTKKGNEVKRGDVVVFHYPLQREVFYVKRVVAVGGDEVMYVNKKLYVHFSQGDSYIEEYYAKEHIKKYRNKLWVENPYMINNKNIYYDDSTPAPIFKYLQSRSAMEEIYLDDENLETYEGKNGEKINAFYFKVTPNHYFMMGDNRENSNDSRFWGEVDKELIYGVPSLVYFNIYDFSRWGVSLENGRK